MKKNTYIVLIGVTLIVLIGILVYTLISPSGTSSTPFPNNQQFPITNSPSGQNATSIELQTATGTIVVRNFLQDPQSKADPVNDGHFQLGTYIDPTDSTAPDVPYNIEYIASTQYFIIVLYQEPIAEARQEAEQFLMNHLGITEEQMCQLKYMVSVPNRVSSYFAGTSLGFSFCPGAVPLE